MIHNEVNEITISYNKKIKQRDKTKITRSSDVVDYLREAIGHHLDVREVFISLYLNRANKIIGHTVISMGGLSATIVDPKLVYSTALKCLASNLVVCHNHPSGNLTPSDQDMRLTKKLKSGGEVLEIGLMDHIILNEDSYLSFADEGIL
jgi:DNA repair protein RadC